MIRTLFSDPVQGIALLAALIIGLTVHEYAHAWWAFRLGDDTAARQGRLTLNPLKHLDPIGSLMMLIVGFGWAKPVPVNGWRLSRRELLEVALAGPVSNIAMATGAGLAARALVLTGSRALIVVATFLAFFALLNLFLAFFNLIPIAPLDGWKVLMGLVSAEQARLLARYETYGPIVLLLVIVLGRSDTFDVFGWLVRTPATWLLRLLAGPFFA